MTNESIPPVDGITILDGDGNLRSLTPADVAADLRAMIDQRLPGGCPDCEPSWHEYVEEIEGVFDLVVFHSETCPRLRPPPAEA